MDVFGDVELIDDAWRRSYALTLFGRTWTVALVVPCDDGEVEAGQREGFVAFERDHERILAETQAALWEHYVAIRPEYERQFGEETAAERLPELESSAELHRVLTPTTLLVQETYDDETQLIGLLLDCTWDPSLGLAVAIVDGVVTEVGPQDLVL